jgi:hypothetical protein
MTVENPYILGHEVHITSRLNVTILYISFLGGGRGIEKYQIWPQNKNIRYPFYQKNMFVVKTGRKSTFLVLKAVFQLGVYVTVLYIKKLAFDFVEKYPFTGKTDR